MTNMRNTYRILVGKLKEKISQGHQRIGGRLILRRIFKEYDARVRTGYKYLKRGSSGGLM
jgi:hypothetical protein